MLPYIFEILPIILAVIASISCAIRFSRDRRVHDRLAMLIAIISSILMIVAQTSWWVTYAIDGNLMGTTFANGVWTVFNSLSMLCLILFAQPWRTNKRKS